MPSLVSVTGREQLVYRLYLDEVGMDDLNHLNSDNHRYLSLTGTILDLNHVREHLIPSVDAIKQEVFEFDPDDAIHFHRTDIVKKRGVFGQLRNDAKRQRFDQLIERLLRETEYTVITALVDKLAMTQQAHWNQTHPYHYLMEIIVEKYTQFLERKSDIGDLMPEARQGKKDRELQLQFENARNDGTRYVNSQRVQSAIRASKLKFRTKKDNIAGLQLCDLIAHPSHMYVRDTLGHAVQLGAFAQMVRDMLIEDKYDRSYSGRISGYGTKVCP